jgi:hypothetical protein
VFPNPGHFRTTVAHTDGHCTTLGHAVDASGLEGIPMTNGIILTLEQLLESRPNADALLSFCEEYESQVGEAEILAALRQMHEDDARELRSMMRLPDPKDRTLQRKFKIQGLALRHVARRLEQPNMTAEMLAAVMQRARAFVLFVTVPIAVRERVWKAYEQPARVPGQANVALFAEPADANDRAINGLVRAALVSGNWLAVAHAIRAESEQHMLRIQSATQDGTGFRCLVIDVDTRFRLLLVSNQTKSGAGAKRRLESSQITGGWFRFSDASVPEITLPPTAGTLIDYLSPR